MARSRTWLHPGTDKALTELMLCPKPRQLKKQPPPLCAVDLAPSALCLTTCKKTNLDSLGSPGERYASVIDCECAVGFYLPVLTFLGRTVETLQQPHRFFRDCGNSLCLGCPGQHVKCGWCDRGTEFYTVFNFNYFSFKSYMRLGAPILDSADHSVCY